MNNFASRHRCDIYKGMGTTKTTPLVRWFGIPLWKRVLAALGEPKRIGMVGGRTVLLFGCTTIMAVALGMGIAQMLQPGLGANLGSAIPKALGPAKSVADQLLGIIPLNIFEALAKGDMLAIIFVALMLGIGTIAAGAAGRPMAAIFQSASTVILRIVTIVMETTPFGVFALIANSVAVNGAAVFINVGWPALGVDLPLAAYAVIMLAAVLAALGIGVEQTALIVGFILPFDRLLDMTRTVASASANLAVTTTVARLEGELDETKYLEQ